MTEPRRPLKLGIRYDVFKRDNFACAYCGRTPPEALLHADHITPVAAGGSNDLANLITACQDCNLGKGAKLLEEGVRPAVNRVAVEELEERIEQAKAYMELVGARQAVTDDMRHMVTDHWAEMFDAKSEERDGATYWVVDGKFPDRASLLRVLRRLSVEDVLTAVDITASRFQRPSADACRYFYGICWKAIKEGSSVGFLPPKPAAPVLTQLDIENATWSGWSEGRASAAESYLRYLRNALDEGKTLTDVVEELSS